VCGLWKEQRTLRPILDIGPFCNQKFINRLSLQFVPCGGKVNNSRKLRKLDGSSHSNFLLNLGHWKLHVVDTLDSANTELALKSVLVLPLKL
jgi:hypothetical protein